MDSHNSLVIIIITYTIFFSIHAKYWFFQTSRIVNITLTVLQFQSSKFNNLTTLFKKIN